MTKPMTVTVSIDQLTVESANWLAQVIRRNNVPHISSAYRESKAGAVTGVVHYVTFREDSADSILDLIENKHFSLQYKDEKWHVDSAGGEFSYFAETISHAALKTFIAVSLGRIPVQVPEVLQGEYAN